MRPTRTLEFNRFFDHGSPAGHARPAALLFQHQSVCFGGLSAILEVVGPKIQAISLALNEYLRLDKAGHYRLYVLSLRLFSDEKPSGGLFGGTPAASEVIEFDISEGEEWANNRAREIEAILSAPGDKASLENTDKNEVRYGALARELRFLDTPLSRRLIIANYGNAKFTYNSDFRFGLMGTRDPNDAIAAMREHLQKPDGAVSSAFLQDLTMLLFAQSNAPTLPRYPNKAAQNSAEMMQYKDFDGKTRKSSKAVCGHAA